jgi:hypothetical protein
MVCPLPKKPGVMTPASTYFQRFVRISIETGHDARTA